MELVQERNNGIEKESRVIMFNKTMCVILNGVILNGVILNGVILNGK